MFRGLLSQVDCSARNDANSPVRHEQCDWGIRHMRMKCRPLRTHFYAIPVKGHRFEP
jgi:hypothetical protein